MTTVMVIPSMRSDALLKQNVYQGRMDHLIMMETGLRNDEIVIKKIIMIHVLVFIMSIRHGYVSIVIRCI